jgi:hypothetical protein
LVTDFRGLLEALSRGEVEFVLVGGAAAAAHGSIRLTQDLDVACAPSDENLRKLVRALAPLDPCFRGETIAELEAIRGEEKPG